MAATNSVKNIKLLLQKFERESNLLVNDLSLIILIYISRHYGIKSEILSLKLKGHITEIEDILVSLIDDEFVEEKNNSLYVTQKGKEIINIIDFSQHNIAEIPNNIMPDYILEKVIGTGNTSTTFKALKTKTNECVVVKVFKPGVFDQINFSDKIKSLSNLRKLSNLILPDDFGEFNWEGVNLKYITMKFVEGKTFTNFLKDNINVDLRFFLKNFFIEIGQTLEMIENVGLNHADLHSDNILVVENLFEKGNGIYHFQIIDFMGIKSNEEFNEFELQDIDYFKQHLFKIIRLYASTPSGEPDLKKLGEKYYRIILNLLEGKYQSFKELNKTFLDETHEVIKLGKIEEPPFSFIRFEQYDINDPLWLTRFEPEKSLYDPVKRFDNVICSGPRGCGKTIYLRSLTFVPRLVKLIQDEEGQSADLANKIAWFENIFGIYFACRQGDFKYFSPTYFDFTSNTQFFIKHIIVLRIIKHTIGLINEAYKEGVYTSEPKVGQILTFLNHFLTKDIMMTKEAKEKPFEQLTNILNMEENTCEDALGGDNKHLKFGEMLNEYSLIDFFRNLQKSVSELSDVKFYIIFDDLSEPQVPLECQEIINSIMACLNEIYCCKFSTEKYAYSFKDMFGKTLQLTNDFTYLDLSFLGRTADTYSGKIYKNYLENIINKRLDGAAYKLGINDVLEKRSYSAEEFISLLSENPTENKDNNIKFGGWDLVVQLSSRSIRDGIAICDSIFRECETVDDLSKKIKEGKSQIPLYIQDIAIRKHSRQEYKGLLNITYHGKEIFDVVRNFGEISRQYLAREITKDERKYEMITIERTDNNKMSDDAQKILRALIRYSVFLDSGLSFSRDEIGLIQKFTLHKKFTPALMTTYREREHLRLSTERLEKFLLYPDKLREEILLRRVIDKFQSKLIDF